jgi:hypothetical protein
MLGFVVATAGMRTPGTRLVWTQKLLSLRTAAERVTQFERVRN